MLIEEFWVLVAKIIHQEAHEARFERRGAPGAHEKLAHLTTEMDAKTVKKSMPRWIKKSMPFGIDF